jgi:hypothetical protein
LSDLILLGATNQLESGVNVQKSTANISGTWPAYSYYFVANNYKISNANQTFEITVAPGAKLFFNEDSYLEFATNAKFSAQGTADEPIYFAANENGKSWGYGSRETYSGGLWFSSTAASGSSIQYAVIINAKNGIYNESTGELENSNSTFEDYKYYGIFDSEGTVISTDNSFNSTLSTSIKPVYQP